MRLLAIFSLFLLGNSIASPVLVPVDFTSESNGVQLQQYDGDPTELLKESGRLLITSEPLSDAQINRLSKRPTRVLVAAKQQNAAVELPAVQAFGQASDSVQVWYGYAVVEGSAQGEAISAQLDQLAQGMKGQWTAPPVEVVQSNRVSLGVGKPRVAGGYR
ncbi:hypothetical protein NT239_06085 [Chitinibacter sp. SCUT-21]|uniref:hypothetical protein n=1 Tax=Chitinibacter sp. SCUT-21 TaxID=2970891 RepID=UPI0035A5F68D